MNTPPDENTPGLFATSLPPLQIPMPPLQPPMVPPSTGSVPVPEASNDSYWSSPAPPRSSRSKVVAVAAILVLVLGAVVGTFLAFSNSGPTAIQSPGEANAALYAAATASGSFHYVDKSSGVVGGSPVTSAQSGDSGLREGVQYMVSTVGNYEVIVINSVAYMKGDLLTLENNFGFSPSTAAPYVNRWIEFTPSDAPYTAVAANVTSRSTWGDASQSPTDGLPTTPRSVSPIATMNGQSVQHVDYSMQGASKAGGSTYVGTERIYFDANGPHVPYYLGEQLSGTTGQAHATENVSVTFSRWGENVTVTAPTGAIPYSSLPPSPTTA